MQTQNASLNNIEATETLPIELSISYSPERTSQLTNDTDFMSSYQLVAGDNVYLTKSGNHTIINAVDTKGAVGPQGPAGPIPNHDWYRTTVAFQLPEGGWGSYVDLQGPEGVQGIPGVYYVPVVTQIDNVTVEFAWLTSDVTIPAPTPVRITLPVPSSQDVNQINARIDSLTDRVSALENV